MTETPSAVRVLLLDDDRFMLELLRDMFGELGRFDVISESDARRALLTLTEYSPDLLVCDLSMPDMDGIEFLRAAAAARFRGHVMLLSGVEAGVRKAAERLARAHGLTVLGAYQKPIRLEQMQQALAQMGCAVRAPSGPANTL